jgi:P-type conjugative transfer protein TrbL
MDILTSSSQTYMNIFHGYLSQFFIWGQWLFFSLLTINIVWMSLWYAFDKHSLSETMPDFIKRFFSIAIFYTIMANPAWLADIVKTAQVMGSTLTHAPIDPSSILSAGLGIANKILLSLSLSSILTLFPGVIIILVVYGTVLFCFISIALDLALTLIITTALISIASFFLGFAALGVTSQIARQTLDVILGNAVKLLGLYLVVAAGSQFLVQLTNAIPVKIISLDPYIIIAAAALLFWLVAKNLPAQLAKIVSGAVLESRGTDAAALAIAAIAYAQRATPAARILSSVVKTAAKIAGSSGYNAAAHFKHGAATGGNPGLSAMKGSISHLGKAVAGSVSDHFKHVASKLSGGSGNQQSIRKISERMYQAAKDVQSNIPSEKE